MTKKKIWVAVLNIGHILVYSLIEPCQEKLYDKPFFVQTWIVSPRFSFHFFSSFKSHTVNLLLIIMDLIIHIYGPTMILYIDQQAESNRCMIWWCSHYLAHISKPFCMSCFFDSNFYRFICILLQDKMCLDAKLFVWSRVYFVKFTKNLWQPIDFVTCSNISTLSLVRRVKNLF